MKIPTAPKPVHALFARGLLLASLTATALLATAAQAQNSRIYRCGNTYTNDVREANTRGCRLVEGGNLTVIQSQPPAASSGAARPSPSASAAAGAARIDDSVQRGRDQQARQILEDELAKSQERLGQLQAEYKDGTPDRLGGERNYQRYLDRTAQLKADIERTQSDIEGIQREISRLTPSN